MSQPHSTPDLSPFEAQLASLIPTSASLARDQVMFQAGRSAARRQYRQAVRRWQGLSALLLLTTLGSWSLGPSLSLTTAPPQLATSMPEPWRSLPRGRDVPPHSPADHASQIVAGRASSAHEQIARNSASNQPAAPLPADSPANGHGTAGQFTMASSPESLDHSADLRGEMELAPRSGPTSPFALTVGSASSAAWSDRLAGPPAHANRLLSVPRTNRELLAEFTR
jgi:hypothetical protein